MGLCMKKVSIIVPVYNSEDWIDDCIASILAQTYINYELILIDDGSTDGSGDKCDSWSLKDGRIFVIHQKNSGVAAARNTGIEKATGDFIVFCDSDDYLEKDYLETFLQMSNKFRADLYIANVYVDVRQVPEIHKIQLLEFYVEKDISLVIHSWFDIYWNLPSNKLYRREIIKQFKIRFTDGLSIGEDGIFTLDYLLHANSIMCSNKPIYHYVQRNINSLSHGYNPDVIRGFDIMISQLHKLAKKYDCDDLELLNKIKMHRAIKLSNQFYLSMMDEKESESEKKKSFTSLRESREERKLLRHTGNLTHIVIGICPYRLCAIYFWFLKWEKRILNANITN